MPNATILTREEWRRRRTADVAGYFPDHVASLAVLSEQPLTELLTWRKPCTGINAVTYQTRGPHLFVTGDLGDAIYTRESGLRWWAGCDLHYFASKCDASEYGRGYREWDGDLALVVAHERWGDDLDAWERLLSCHGLDAIHHEHDWNSWLQENAIEVWGANWMDAEPWGIGRVIAARCELHLTGLKLALQQVDHA